jgi:GTPase
MAEQTFIDYVKICFRSGKGGAGSSHFYRGPGTPKGGPDGGDGGRGGRIILVGERNEWTLLSLRYRRHIYAEDGGNGTGAMCSGKQGEDIYVPVPLGTVAKDAETGEILLEITETLEQKVLLDAGRGGKGNAFFRTSTLQSPKFAQPGEPGKEQWIILELKVLADVGLVGFPNAGKSTLLSAVSAARPKIAEYAFTTLTPNLGFVEVRPGQSFVMADIPGIIEGAHAGKGLGHRFLRHIERNSVLLFMVPCDTNRNIKDEYDILMSELRLYNPELVDKPRMLAVTKSDLIDADLEKMLRSTLPPGIEVVFISSIAEKNIQLLKNQLWHMLTAENM